MVYALNTCSTKSFRMTEPERQPLLISEPPEQHPSRRCRVGCIMLFIFLQFLSSNGIKLYLRLDITDVFNLELDKMYAVVVGGAVLIYILPAFIGLYADVIVGKYTALFSGLCLKALGSLLLFFVVLRIEAWPEVDPITLKVLAAVFSAGVVMFCVGLFISFPTLLSLGSQQINQQTESQASFIRWCLMVMVAGAITENFLDHFDIYIPYNPPWLTHHPQSVRHGASLTLDVLSLAIFIFGKPFYIKPSPAEGRKSLKNLMCIARNYTTCLSSRRDDDTIDKSLRMRDVHDIVSRRTLERLRIRKGVITIPLFSALAASFAAFLGLDTLTVNNVEFYQPGKLYQFGFVRIIRMAIFLPIVPLMELTIRKCGHHLWQNTLANQLKALGFGMVLNTICSLTAGVVASILPHRDYIRASVLYVLPQYILLGLASFVIYSSGLTFCLTQCPTGLSTFVIVLCLSFGLLVFPIGALIGTKADWDKFMPYTDVVCYVMAGVLLVLFLIYIPVSIWYMKASRAIDMALEDKENNETHDNARSMHPVA